MCILTQDSGWKLAFHLIKEDTKQYESKTLINVLTTTPWLSSFEQTWRNFWLFLWCIMYLFACLFYYFIYFWRGSWKPLLTWSIYWELTHIVTFPWTRVLFWTQALSPFQHLFLCQGIGDLLRVQALITFQHL